MPGRDQHPDPLAVCPSDLALATDLYQLTMAAVYHRHAGDRQASFELFVRRLPPRRNFLVFAGLEQALASLLALRFDGAQVEYLRSLPPFADHEDGFFERLRDFRFSGHVEAMPEGTVFFPHEPVLRVTGSLIEAQLAETLLLATINFQTAVASKAARIRLAAGDEVQLAEFGSRRAHGPQAGVWAARAAVLGGFDATSNVLAGQRLGIPLVGTMAHSFILAFESEAEAFRHYRDVFPEHTILLVDTYDTLQGVRRALELGMPFDGVRLDSGDIAALARQVRRLLDEGGRRDVRIFVSGDMDENRIRRLLADGAPIDAFGVGTQIATSADAPFVPGIYKLVEVELGSERVARRKRSSGKAMYAGRKQVLRTVQDGRWIGDRLVPVDRQPGTEEQALLQSVLEDGRIVRPLPDLATSRRRCRAEVAALPPSLRGLEPADGFELEVDPELTE